jgi:hypothetical protein
MSSDQFYGHWTILSFFSLSFLPIFVSKFTIFLRVGGYVTVSCVSFQQRQRRRLKIINIIFVMMNFIKYINCYFIQNIYLKNVSEEIDGMYNLLISFLFQDVISSNDNYYNSKIVNNFDVNSLIIEENNRNEAQLFN